MKDILKSQKALIGYSGYVGSTLLKQHTFEHCFRSTTISKIDGQKFDLAICCAAPAQKWIANREPDADFQRIDNLIKHLETIECKTFVLISTVDVFIDTSGVKENTPVVEKGLHAYGLHRRLLEKFVEDRFPKHLIIRLPGLVGPGLRKNVIFDLLNDNNLNAIDSRSVFQFYPMVNLWYDIQTALNTDLKLVHLTAEPITVANVSEQGFGKLFNHVCDNRPAAYDFQSNHAALFGGQGLYQYSRRDTIQAVRAYAQSESGKIKTEDVIV